MAKLKLPFELEKPSANEWVTKADQIGYGNDSVAAQLDKIATIDNTPLANSQDVVKGGGVESVISLLGSKIELKKYTGSLTWENGYYDANGSVQSSNSTSHCIADISEYVGCLFLIKTRAIGSLYVVVFDSSMNVLETYRSSDNICVINIVNTSSKYIGISNYNSSFSKEFVQILYADAETKSVTSSGLTAGFINTSGLAVGDIVPNTITTSSNYKHTDFIRVRKNDVIVLTTKISTLSTSGMILPIIITDLSYHLKKYFNVTSYNADNECFAIEEDGYICAHCGNSFENSFALLVKTASEKVKDLVKLTNTFSGILGTIDTAPAPNSTNLVQSEGTWLNSKIHEVVNKLNNEQYNDITGTLTWSNGYYNSSGQVVSADNAKYCTIDVSQYIGCRIAIVSRTRASLYNCLFDSSMNLIEGVHSDTDNVTILDIKSTGTKYLGISTLITSLKTDLVRIYLLSQYKRSVQGSELTSGFYATNNTDINGIVPQTITSSSKFVNSGFIRVFKNDIVILNTQIKSVGIAGAVQTLVITDMSYHLKRKNIVTEQIDRNKVYAIDEDGYICAHCHVDNVNAFSLTVLTASQYCEQLPSESGGEEVEGNAEFEIMRIPLDSLWEEGQYYNNQLAKTADANAKCCELDVSDFVGCLARIPASDYSSGWYDGFRTATYSVLQLFTKFDTADIPSNEGFVMFPIPRACDYSEWKGTSQAAAKYLRISIAKNRTDDMSNTLLICKKYHSNGLIGKNIAIVGSSVLSLYFGNKQYQGTYFLYHLAPMFGYNIICKAIGSSSYSTGNNTYYDGEVSETTFIEQYNRALTELQNDSSITRKYFDIVFIADASNDGFNNFSNFSYDDIVKGVISKIGYEQELGNTLDDYNALSTQAKAVIDCLYRITTTSPRCRLFINKNACTGGVSAFTAGTGSRYILNKLNYYRNIQRAFCDVFNASEVNLLNDFNWRAWNELYSSGRRVMSNDNIHINTPYGGWLTFRVYFEEILKRFDVDALGAIGFTI